MDLLILSRNSEVMNSFINVIVCQVIQGLLCLVEYVVHLLKLLHWKNVFLINSLSFFSVFEKATKYFWFPWTFKYQPIPLYEIIK